MKANRFIIALIILLVLSGCGISPDDVAATVTQAVVEIAETQAAMVTETPIPSPTPLPTVTPTPTPNVTATLEAIGTELAGYMKADIQELYKDGYVSTTDGSHYLIPDFEESFANLHYMRWYPIDYRVKNFVLRGSIAWEMASSSGDYSTAGCGFYWGLDEKGTHYYVAFLKLDGYSEVLVNQDKSIYIESAGKGYYGKIDPMKGNAEIMTIVEGHKIQFFVNGERVFNRENQYELDGWLGYGIYSGTNAGFGTRCTFTDVELWMIGE